MSCLHQSQRRSALDLGVLWVRLDLVVSLLVDQIISTLASGLVFACAKLVWEQKKQHSVYVSLQFIKPLLANISFELFSAFCPHSSALPSNGIDLQWFQQPPPLESKCLSCGQSDQLERQRRKESEKEREKGSREDGKKQSSRLLKAPLAPHPVRHERGPPFSPQGCSQGRMFLSEGGKGVSQGRLPHPFPSPPRCLFHHSLLWFFFVCLLFPVQNLPADLQTPGTAVHGFKVNVSGTRSNNKEMIVHWLWAKAGGSGLLIMCFLCGDSLLAG